MRDPRFPAWPRTPSLTAGELFDDRYELVRDLGSGTAGEVWEAVDKRLGRTVALTSRLIVDGLRPSSAAIVRSGTPVPS